MPRSWFLSFLRSTGPSPWKRMAFKHATEKCPARTRRARRPPCLSRTQRWVSRPPWKGTVGPFPSAPELSSPTATHLTSCQHHPYIPPPPYPTHTTSTMAWCPHSCEMPKQAPESCVYLGISSLACLPVICVNLYICVSTLGVMWMSFSVYFHCGGKHQLT